MIVKVLFVAAISVCLCLWCAFRERKKALLDFFAAAAFLLYVYFVLSITVFRTSAANASGLELVPFYSYYLILTKGWHYMSIYVVMEILGNILLFVPLGIIISQLIKQKYSWCYALIIAALLSLAIEMYQLRSGLGTFQIDDVIHNCLGAIFGNLVGASVVLIKKGENKKAAVKCLPILFFLLVLSACSMVSIFFN